MSAATANAGPPPRRIRLAWAARQRVVIALALLILFGALRYDHFLGAYNVLSVLRYNSMFALTSLGMELDAIAAVAVGGTPFTGGQATVVGTLVGALLIQLVRYTLLANGVPDAAALVVKGAIIAGAVWSQQRGRSA